jgi:hypothetical protein
MGACALVLLSLSSCQLTTSTNTFDGLSCPVNQTTGVEASAGLGVGNQTYNGTAIAQTFRTPISQDISITKARLGLYRQGWPNGQLTLRIQTDNGGSPSGSDVSSVAVQTLSYTSTESTQTSTFKTYAEFFDFDFSSAVSLTKDTLYWIILRTTATVNTNTFVLWAATTQNPYSSGGAFYESMTTGSSIFRNDLIGTTRDTVFALCTPSPSATATSAMQYFSPEPPFENDEPSPEPTQ